MELSKEIAKLRCRMYGQETPKWGDAFGEAYKRINARRGVQIFNGTYYTKSVDFDVVKAVNSEMRKILKEIGAKTDA